jgi:hypothetical protein
MTQYEITAPEPQFSGEVAGVVFSKGKATLDSDHPDALAALSYFRRRGYGVGGDPVAEAAEPFEPADPRGLATVEGGTLRDGAVEARGAAAGRAPTAGGGHPPHGPRVVSPEAPTPPGHELATEAAVEGEKSAGRPARAASKAEWVAYADRQEPGTDHSSMTKEQLVERYGGGN